MSKKAVALMLAVLFSIGCRDAELSPSGPSVPPPKSVNTSKVYRVMMEYADRTCGSLHIDGKQPFFDLTGEVTASVYPNTTVYLQITPSLSFNHTMYVVENCMPPWRATVNQSGQFSFTDLIPGKYVLSIPASRFTGAHGFPIPDEFNQTGHRLRVSFQGGDQEHSVSAFEIY